MEGTTKTRSRRRRDVKPEAMEFSSWAIEDLCIATIRTLAMDAVQRADSGHPGTPMALAPLAFVLWDRIMRYDPKDPDWFDRDRFVPSAGHACMLQYAALHLTGYDLSIEDLRQFRQWAAGRPAIRSRRARPASR